mmetsp:Transcript_12270/g.42765  ORF Transcript_12270/g.42765 Transcript_12270/m.42765 type:complete len:234 (-) Transcript_12270:1147-1848(-)
MSRCGDAVITSYRLSILVCLLLSSLNVIEGIVHNRGAASIPRSSNMAQVQHRRMARLRGGSTTEPSVSDGPRFLSTPVESWIEENFPVQSRKEFGHACLGFGSCMVIFCLMPIPVVGCFLNRSGLLTGNILIFLGSILVAGPRAVRRFLFCKSRRFGSLVMFVGVTLMWKRIVLLGLVIELLGVASLFGPFLDSFLGFLSPWVPRSLGACFSLMRKICWAWSSPVLKLFTPTV